MSRGTAQTDRLKAPNKAEIKLQRPGGVSQVSVISLNANFSHYTLANWTPVHAGVIFKAILTLGRC